MRSDPGDRVEALDPRTLAELRREYDEYVERARQYHAEHGVWPPDPLLDEVEEARREIMAEHGNDWRKFLEYYVELDRQNPDRLIRLPKPDDNSQSAA